MTDTVIGAGGKAVEETDNTSTVELTVTCGERTTKLPGQVCAR